MRSERANFLRRLQAISSACEESLLVNNADSSHNERAKQLRCGLCVMIFSALEDFLRERIAQILEHITPASLPFSNLSQKFQTSASQVALQSLAFQSQYIEEDQRLAFLRAEFKKLATLGENHYSISRYAFSNSKTNVQASEIFDVLDSFLVEKPWEAIYYTARRLQLATANPAKQEFEQLATARHSAAHKQIYDIPSIDLKAKVASAMSIGVAFDIVLSSAALNMNSSIARHQAMRLLKAGDIKIYFISENPYRGKYRLIQDGQPKSKTLNSDPALHTVKAIGLQKLAIDPGVLVIQDGTGKPKEWYCRAAGE
ncbi:HEPN domain-containing protein [Burkholderia ubonensis]|uniref:HEPN domain-containing protein n=1 Tax=Burkholderia ubonensis TaxID=101571 RepID=UPI000AF5F83F|nr:HEPN domain-containing protein [Burkholderia ubonensis]